MLAKLHRFHGSASLQFVLKRGKTARQPDIALRHTYNKKSKHARVAVIVSKKVHKSAVKRNRIRRRVYAVARMHVKFSQPIDYVFFVYKDTILILPQEELSRQVAKLVRVAESS